MSRVGWEILLKTVLHVFMLPQGLCEELERLMNSYWWECEAREKKGHSLEKLD